MRQVWLEVQLLRALSLAKRVQCSEALNIADHLSEPVPELPFTKDGLEPFLRSARLNYLMGSLYKSCNQPDRASASFSKAAEESNLPDAVWSWRAAQEVGKSDQNSAKQGLASSLQRLKNSGESTSPTGWVLYNEAMLDRALGNTEQAAKEFREAILRPDQLMSYHLTRLALLENNP